MRAIPRSCLFPEETINAAFLTSVMRVKEAVKGREMGGGWKKGILYPAIDCSTELGLKCLTSLIHLNLVTLIRKESNVRGTDLMLRRLSLLSRVHNRMNRSVSV